MDIYKTMAKNRGYRWDQITGKQKDARLVSVRREIAKAMYDAGMIYNEIARELNRDHTTIINLIDDDYASRKRKKSLENYYKNK